MLEIGQKTLPAGSDLTLAERVYNRYSLIREDWFRVQRISDPVSITFVVNFRRMRWEKKTDLSNAQERLDLVFYHAGTLVRRDDGAWTFGLDALGFVENGGHAYQLQDGKINTAYWDGEPSEKRNSGVQKVLLQMEPFSLKVEATQEVESMYQAWRR